MEATSVFYNTTNTLTSNVSSRVTTDSVNLGLLEKIMRVALKGEGIDSDAMLQNGMISPAVYRSLTSLSAQIAAQVSSGHLATDPKGIARAVPPWA